MLTLYDLVHYDPALDPANEPELVYGVPRSSRWPKVRAEHLVCFPTCAACGSKTAIAVHHEKPFHLYPDLELDPTNLVTLCECPSHNCHLIFGHNLSWRAWNPHVREDAAQFLDRIANRRVSAE